MGSWEDYLREHQQQYLDELLEFLRIPSISSLPEHKEDVHTAAEWVSARLNQAGMEDVQVLETGGHPVVCRRKAHDSNLRSFRHPAGGPCRPVVPAAV